MPNSSTSPGYYGAMTHDYISPFSGSYGSVGWAAPNFNYFNDKDTAPNLIAGTIGPVKFYSKNVSPFKGIGAIQEMDSGVLMNDWNRWNSMSIQFYTDFNVYEAARILYNEANNAEKARQVNPFKIFDDPITIPKRVCKPDQPENYIGT